MIEKKLTHGLHTMKSNMEKLINAKLGQQVGIKNYVTSELENANTTTTTTNNTTSSYAAAVGKSGDNISGNFRAIILTAKNEELAEEADRKRRAANLIIHGKDEEVGPNDDKKFINDLITDLQIGVINIKYTGRIGNKGGRTRPIKLVFNNEEDKEKVLNNLKNIKGTQIYKGISITSDQTYSERMLIKEYYERAKAKNVLEGGDSSFVWRVVGVQKTA